MLAPRISERLVSSADKPNGEARSAPRSHPAHRPARAEGLAQQPPARAWGLGSVKLLPATQDVRLRDDAAAAQFLARHAAIAATLDRDTIAVNRALPPSGRVLAHELAHIAQLRSGRTASRAEAEAEAARAAAGAPVAPQESVGAAPPPLFLTVAEQIAAAASKGEVFDLLRGLPAGSANTPEITAALQARFANAPDDLWLATQLQLHGPEPLWDPALVAERARRASANKWAPEPGNIGADLTTPGEKQTVRAYFFPGQDPEKRALVFAGVHQSEPEGIAVAEALRARLAADSAAGRPPAYTTIVVPNLFEDRHTRERTIGKLDPNRNFPGDVAPDVRGGSGAATDAQGRAILAENRILMALVERFQPQRVASIHAHSLKDVQGDAPGVFVDPRADPTAQAQDVGVAGDMARAVAAGLKPGAATSADPGVNPVIGNYAAFTTSERAKHGGKQKMLPASKPNVLYDPAAPTLSKGVSAGGWFPKASAMPGGGAARRAPVAIYTIELPEWRKGKEAKALPKVEQLEAKVLEEILLGTKPAP